MTHPEPLPSAAAPDAKATGPTHPAALPSAPGRPGTPTRRLSSRDLLGQAQEVEITHGSQCYRLRLTSLGKLILTK